MSEVEKLLEMASSSLSDAELVEDESDRLFWNSVYYAVFYAAKAALMSEGVEPKSHSGTDAQLGRVLYKEEEVLDSEEAAFYSLILEELGRKLTSSLIRV